MGIGGHMLGPRKLRRLRNLTGLNLRRAYIRGRGCEGVVGEMGPGHIHYRIDPKVGDYEPIANPMHWGSCSMSDEELAEMLRR